MNIRDAARGQPCTLRLYAICCGDWSTTVLAHDRRNGAGGMGLKPKDEDGMLACFTCHDAIDGRLSHDQMGAPIDRYSDEIQAEIDRARIETARRLERMQ